MHQSQIGLLLPWGTMRYMDMNTYTTLLYMVIYIYTTYMWGLRGRYFSTILLHISLGKKFGGALGLYNWWGLGFIKFMGP